MVRKGFTFIEVIVTLGVLAAVLLVVNQVVASAVQQVKIGRNNFYVGTVMSEAVAHLDFIQNANLLRYGEADFDECRFASLEQGVDVECDNIDKYEGKYLVVVKEEGGRNSWRLVKVPDDLPIVDGNGDFAGKEFVFEVYEKKVGNAVMYTNVESVQNLDEDKYKPMGYYRYVYIYPDGNYEVQVVYVDHLNRVRVEESNYVASDNV